MSNYHPQQTQSVRDTRKRRLKRKATGYTRRSEHGDPTKTNHHSDRTQDEKLYIDMSDLRDTKRNKKLKPTKLVIHTGIEKTPSAAATDN